jgi:hypothetical protein
LHFSSARLPDGRGISQLPPRDTKSEIAFLHSLNTLFY